LQTELAMALFETFFSHRGDVDNMELLVDVACSVGLDPDEARSVLNEARFAGTVREQQAQWRERDIHAVPAFFFQQQYMVQGAQEADTFARILGKIRAKEVK
jgi:predicted DsbA family dithiol-disulfide isomerase